MIVQIAVYVGLYTVDDEAVPALLSFEEVGDRFDFESGGSTDEGFSYTQESYELVQQEDGTLLIERQSYIRAKDCDGLMEYWRTHVARVTAVNNLAAVWIQEEAVQRDHTAESMGY